MLDVNKFVGMSKKDSIHFVISPLKLVKQCVKFYDLLKAEVRF